MAKVIVGIHGLGNKPSPFLLQKWWEASINEGLTVLGMPVPDVHLHLVYWADVFYEKSLDENMMDLESPIYLHERYTPAPLNDKKEEHPLRQKVLDILEKELDRIFLNEDLSINFSSIADSVIHRYFKELDEYYSKDIPVEGQQGKWARDIIRGRLIRILEEHREDDIMLIGHSMGSIIAYDVIDNLISDVDIHTFVTLGSPLGFPVIMGKIAADRDVSLRRLNKLRTPEPVKGNWFNLSDLEDRIALIYRLSENFDANSSGIRVADMIVHNNYEINGKRNPHKSFGYLRTPEMAGIIYDFLVMRRSNWFSRIGKKWRQWFGSV
jgi:hypothetical protein